MLIYHEDTGITNGAGSDIMCELCRQTICPPLCPNYVIKNADAICELCNNAIEIGEEYIENPAGECIHFECRCYMTDRKLLKWLEMPVKTMR